MLVLQAALDYCARGWVVFPLRGKVPTVKWTEAVNDPAWIVAQDWPGGVGCACGEKSKVIRLDVDSDEALVHLKSLVGDLPTTPEFITPNRGHGWLFAYGGETTEVLWKGPGIHQEIRVQSDGYYTVLPPSPHPDGGVYQWIIAPWDAPLAPAPPALRDLMRGARAGRLVRELEKQLGVSSDQPGRSTVLEALEHVTCFDDYDGWLQVGMALKSVDETLLGEWETWSRRSAKFEEGACAAKWATFSGGSLTGRTIIHLARLNGWTPKLKEHPFTDLGNSRRIADQHRGCMVFCHPWDRWLVWDGCRWRPDDSGAAVRKAKETVDSIFETARKDFAKAAAAAKNLDDAGKKERIKRASSVLSHAMKSQSEKSITSALLLARSEMPVQPESLDQDSWLLNCPNGTLDLRTGAMRPHSKDDCITKLCPTELSGVPCPRWLQFLDEVFVGRTDLVSWLQKLMGYCLTGDTSEHVLPILWGGGANGKSTLVNVLLRVLGSDYSGKAQKELLLLSKYSQHPTGLAALHGKRLVAAVESGESAKLDEVTVKELTGGDRIKCRRMREDFWEFVPTHKILLATNYRPVVLGTDEAIWRRILLIPFEATFDDSHQDKFLLEKLTAEAPGILQWLVDGCLRWQKEGLGRVEAVKLATASYRAEQDRLADFIDEHYEKNVDGKVRIQDFRELYSSWCFRSKVVPLNHKELAPALLKKGFDRDGTKKFYLGLVARTNV